MKLVKIVLVSLGLVAILSCAYLGYSLRGRAATTENSKFRDEKFLVVLFPSRESVPCRRAVLASLSEYNRESIEVYVDGIAVAMPKSDFTAEPPQDYASYIERLNKELDAWGMETDWSNVGYTVAPSEGGAKAILVIRDKRGTTCRYTYLVTGPSVHPLDVTTEVNISKKMAQ